jgi:hypothetical protein
MDQRHNPMRTKLLFLGTLWLTMWMLVLLFLGDLLVPGTYRDSPGLMGIAGGAAYPIGAISFNSVRRRMGRDDR